MIGYLGPEGSHTHAALQAYLKQHPVQQHELIRSYVSIQEVIEALCAGSVQHAFLPLKNSLSGDVFETQNALRTAHNTLVIEDSFSHPIHHAFGVLKPTPHAHVGVHVARIFSKDHALQQCSKYLHRQHPHAVLHFCTSTTEAMRLVAENKWEDAAVVGPEAGLIAQGFHICARAIENTDNNTTDFGWISQRKT